MLCNSCSRHRVYISHEIYSQAFSFQLTRQQLTHIRLIWHLPTPSLTPQLWFATRPQAEMLQHGVQRRRRLCLSPGRAVPCGALLSTDVRPVATVHPTVPTLSWVDERPHRTWSEQVATKCACCQGPSSGQRARAAAVAGRLGSLDECSKRYRGGHDAPPRHTLVVSILVAVIGEIQVSLHV